MVAGGGGRSLRGFPRSHRWLYIQGHIASTKWTLGLGGKKTQAWDRIELGRSPAGWGDGNRVGFGNLFFNIKFKFKKLKKETH